MRTSPGELEAYLVPDESVVAGTAGTLLDGSFQSEGVVGVTDRRVLFVADDGRFVDVAHDAVSSIRSRPHRGITYPGVGPAALVILGGGVATAAFVGALALEPGFLGFVLLLATVGGTAAAEQVRRGGGHAVRQVAASTKSALLDALPGRERLPGPVERAGEDADPDLLVLGLVSVALTALIGLIATTGGLLVVPHALATVGGLALVEYGYRRERERDTAPSGRPLRREVSVHLVDGRVVRLRIDPDGRFDRDLSAAVRGSAATTANVELSRS